MEHRVGIVVPTLGTRLDLLKDCLQSIRGAGECFICVVVPRAINLADEIDHSFCDLIISDPGRGLAEAINFGIASLPDSVEFCNWLGDDDLLEPMSLDESVKVLEKSMKTVLVYGNCTYIDSTGKKLWKNSAGAIASFVLRFGPCLVPQPGSLFRRRAFDQVGRLNPDYGWAFDYDLFIRLSNIGKINYMNRDTASFRWHLDSLTVSQRKNSVDEASRVRKSNYSYCQKVFSPIWEPLVRFATLHAPKLFD